MHDGPTAVLVLGMHRSGTSAFTRLVHLLGVPVGPDAELMGAEATNRHGHWEALRLVALDDDLLASVGARWAGPPAEPIGPAEAPDLVERGRAAWTALFGDGSGVWKDPRLCLTLPFWRAALPATPVGVLCLRHPAAVAASLAARDGFAPAYGLALWERHTRAVLRSGAGMAMHVARYEDLVAAPRQHGAALADFLAAHTTLVPAGERARAWASIDPADRHQHDHDDAELSPSQRALLEVLDALVGSHTSLPELDLPEETPGLDLAFGEHDRMASYADEAQQLRAGLEEQAAAHERATAALLDDLHARSAQATELADELAATARQAQEAQAALDSIRSRRSFRAVQAVRRFFLRR